jgi:hypothetical protein
MNDISRVSGGNTPYPIAPAADGGTGAGAGAGADVTAHLTLSRLDPTQTVAQLTDLTALLKANLPTGSSITGGGNSITNGNGAPSIDGVTMNFSAEDMAAMLVALQGKTQDAQLATAKEGIKTNQKKLEDQNQRAMEKIKEWAQKCEEASAKEKTSGILGWFKKIFTVVAAAFAVVAAGIATAATGGAAAPLLALAVLGLASSIVDIASAIDKEMGGEGFDHVLQWMDPATLIGKGFGELAKAMGADEDQVAIVTATFAVVGTIALMAASVWLTGGASITKDLSSLSKTILTASRIGQAVAGVGTGATQAAKGGVDIAVAKDQNQADLLQVDKKNIDAVIAKLQKQMEDDREDVKKVLNEMMEGMNIVSQMINSASQSRAQLTANLNSNKSQTI